MRLPGVLPLRRLRWIGPLAVLLSIAAVSTAPAATLEPVGAFDEPTFVTSDPSNPNRVLVAERRGAIELVAGGHVATFADLTSLVGCPPAGCEGERGLMSIAVAPDFATSGHLYADYIDNSSGEIHIDELTASGDTAPLASRRPVLSIPHSEASNHNGGQLQFGPDGDLYISTGDGGGSNDEFHHSQDLGSLLGKILRIDPEQSGAQPYTVPAGNPFPTAQAPFDTIWSYGLRNPFRFSFDRLSGDMVIGDVGQGAREEVDFAPRGAGETVGGGGANYGWNCREGLIAGPATDLPGTGCTTTSFVDPVFDYPHSGAPAGAAQGCAIIGGYVARDPSLGGLDGRYLYGDLCAGQIRSLQLPASASGTASGDRSEGLSVPNLNSFGEDSCGRLYTVSGDGAVSRLVGAAPASCPPPEGPSGEEEPPPGAVAPPGPPRTDTPGSSPIETTVRVKAVRYRVPAGARASLTVDVLPCDGGAGQMAQLNRGGRRLASAPLDDDCTARFRPRIAHRSSFRVLVPAIGAHLAGRSPRVTIEAG